MHLQPPCSNRLFGFPPSKRGKKRSPRSKRASCRPSLLEEEESKQARADVLLAYKDLQSSLMRKMILEEKQRIDGRKLNEIRPIDIEQAILPRTHGSSLFTRGETQTLAVCTLGGETTAQRYEDLHGEGLSRFYLQYFFPPFSVGEVGRMGAPGRREIGHGKLAERALASILPKQEDIPLRHPPRVEYHRIERLLFDGLRLRRLPCHDGCWRAYQDAPFPASRWA